MIKAIITDFSRVLLFPADKNYMGGLNELNNKQLKENPNYSFLDFFTINKDLLKHYSELNKTIPVHIFTSETIQDHPSIKIMIDNSISSVLSASKLGVHKSKQSSYEKILSILKLKPEEVVYVDDKKSNLDVARLIGIKTIHHKDNLSTITELNKITRLS